MRLLYCHMWATSVAGIQPLAYGLCKTKGTLGTVVRMTKSSTLLTLYPKGPSTQSFKATDIPRVTISTRTFPLWETLMAGTTSALCISSSTSKKITYQ